MNVILYVADALRADHCSCYGYERETTPTIDTLGADGTVFENCFTQATWTRAAAASILTGCYPDAHKTETRSDALAKNVPYIPERFAEAGFETLGVSAMGNVSTVLGFDRGFDTYVDLYKDEAVRQRRRQSTTDQEKLPDEDTDIVAYPRANDITPVVTDWLADRPDTDCFVMIWAIDPHDPYDPPADAEYFLDPVYDGDSELGRSRGSLANVSEEAAFERLINLYDSEIRYMDDCLGDLVAWLQRNDQYDDTLLAVTGDHGESFGERTYHDQPVTAHNTPPYDERLHVPLVIKPPEIPADDRIELLPDRETDLVESIDISPSLLTMTGIESDRMQGTPVTHDHTKQYTFSKTQQDRSQATYYSIRSREWKFIDIDLPPIRLRHLLAHPRHFLRHVLGPSSLLFDLTADPLERENQTTNRPTIRSRLARGLDDWKTDAAAFGTDIRQVAEQIDSETERQLEKLGYKT